ncbi:hypothetical protein ACJD0Z_15165 [Flavobacteriaceae bacterium M23B6Z8]
MKFKENIICSIILIILSFSCKKQQDIEIAEIEAINDIFLELVKDRHLYQDQDDFIEEYYRTHTDSISLDSMNILYRDKKKVLKYGTLLLKDKLVPLTKDEKELLKEINEDDPAVQYTIVDDDVSFNLNSISNRGNYTIIRKTEDYSNIGKDATSAIRFSRVHFNREMDKAAFSYEIICGELCYSRGLILISRNEKDKWVIVKGYPIEIS